MHLPESSGGDFELTPSGTHVAVCYRFIDLGTQQVDWQGQAKHQHKVMISWELPDERMKDGRPFSIHQRYTWSMNEKARLRKDLEAWRGLAFTEHDLGPNGFNVKKLLGVGCYLGVVHKTEGANTYANIASLMKLPKSMVAPKPENDIVYLALTKDGFDQAVFDGLGKNLKETIMKSPEYAELHRPQNDRDAEPPPADDERAYGGHGGPDDAIPFAPFR